MHFLTDNVQVHPPIQLVVSIKVLTILNGIDMSFIYIGIYVMYPFDEWIIHCIRIWSLILFIID